MLTEQYAHNSMNLQQSNSHSTPLQDVQPGFRYTPDITK